MLQRASSDAAKRVRDAKKPPQIKRERFHPPTDPAQLHEQAVVAAVRAHEIAYGIARSSMEDDKTRSSARPSLERQGSHIARHLSNASNKPARPKNVRKSTSTARITNVAATTPVATSRASTATPSAYPSSEPRSNPFRRGMQKSSEREVDQAGPSLRSTPSSNKLRKKASYTTERSAGSALAATVDSSQHIVDTTSSHVPPARNSYELYETHPSLQTDDAVATLACERYLGDHQDQQYLRSSPSARSYPFLPRSNKSRQDYPGTESTGHSAESAAQPSRDNEADSTKSIKTKKSRRISLNITKTIRRAFGRRNVTPPTDIPPQQVQANRPHYGSESTMASRRLSVSTIGGGPGPDVGDSKTPTPTPSIYEHKPRTHQQLASTISSMDTYYTKSRVTSWMTDSSKDYTTKLRDIDPQLPSIQESPQRTVSQSGSLYPKLGSDVYDYAPQAAEFQAPKPRATDDSPNRIDSKRLLSALRTHISGPQVRSQRSSDMRNASGSTNMTWQSSDMTPMRNFNIAAPQQEERFEMSANIRDFSTPEFPFDMSYMPSHEHEIHDPHYRMMSPSVYSFRPGVGEKQPQDSVISLPRRSPSPGVAIISESHQVSKWSLDAQPSPSKPPTTSGEWRSWAADELADLEDAASEPVVEPKHKSNNPFARMAERRASAKLTESATPSSPILPGELHLDQLAAPPVRPRLLGTSSDSMNERFPMLPTTKKAGPSPASSRKTSLSKSSAYDMDKDGESSLKAHSSPINPRVDHALPKKRSNLALHVMSSDDVKDLGTVIRSRNADKRKAARQAKLDSKSKADPKLKEQPSLALLLAEERSREAEPPQRLARLPAPLDDKFLLRIRKGPYGSSSPEKPNSSVESLDLLARKKGTGVGGLKQGMKLGGDENVRMSPTKGQKMVDDFLGKRFREYGEDVDEGHGSSPRFL